MNLARLIARRGPWWGFAGCGIRPFLSAGFGIGYKISRDTGFKLSWHHSGCWIGPKNNCGIRETTWFSRGLRDPYTPIGGPLEAGRSKCWIAELSANPAGLKELAGLQCLCFILLFPGGSTKERNHAIYENWTQSNAEWISWVSDHN